MQGFRGWGGEGLGSVEEGKSWDRRQLARGTRTGWAASISHSVSPVRIVSVRERVSVSMCVVVFFLFLSERLSQIPVNYVDFVLSLICLGHKISFFGVISFIFASHMVAFNGPLLCKIRFPNAL